MIISEGICRHLNVMVMYTRLFWPAYPYMFFKAKVWLFLLPGRSSAFHHGEWSKLCHVGILTVASYRKQLLRYQLLAWISIPAKCTPVSISDLQHCTFFRFQQINGRLFGRIAFCHLWTGHNKKKPSGRIMITNWFHLINELKWYFSRGVRKVTVRFSGIHFNFPVQGKTQGLLPVIYLFTDNPTWHSKYFLRGHLPFGDWAMISRRSHTVTGLSPGSRILYCFCRLLPGVVIWVMCRTLLLNHKYSSEVLYPRQRIAKEGKGKHGCKICSAFTISIDGIFHWHDSWRKWRKVNSHCRLTHQFEDAGRVPHRYTYLP